MDRSHVEPVKKPKSARYPTIIVDERDMKWHKVYSSGLPVTILL